MLTWRRLLLVFLLVLAVDVISGNEGPSRQPVGAVVVVKPRGTPGGDVWRGTPGRGRGGRGTPLVEVR